MKKILHFSDLHIQKNNNATTRTFKFITLKLKEIAPSEDTVILITGDIVDNGSNKKYWKAAEPLINELKKYYPLNQNLFVVPGNHDYGDRFGITPNKYAIQKFHNLFGSEFPKINYVTNDNKSLALIGLDSMADLIKDSFKKEIDLPEFGLCKGKFGVAQLKRLENELINNKKLKETNFKVLYFHHNPYDPSDLSDIKELWKVIDDTNTKIDYILFGHDHIFQEYPQKKVPGYDAGSTTGVGTIDSKSKLPKAVPYVEQPPKARLFDVTKGSVSLLDIWPEVVNFKSKCGENQSAKSTKGLLPLQRVAINDKTNLSNCIKGNDKACVYGISLVYNSNVYDYCLYIDAKGPKGLTSGCMYLKFWDESGDFYRLSIPKRKRKKHKVSCNSHKPEIAEIEWKKKWF